MSVKPELAYRIRKDGTLKVRLILVTDPGYMVQGVYGTC